jgi:FO synthase
MEENISRMAGSQHGVRLDPEQLIGAARAAGRTPAQRSTLYDLIETY